LMRRGKWDGGMDTHRGFGPIAIYAMGIDNDVRMM